jgi:pyridoxal biosynthesis lyase PdxS
MRTIRGELRRLTSLPPDELYVAAKELQAPYELVKEVAEAGRLPVVLFTAGGIATPADAAMMMQLGAEGVFVGSGIFKSGNPAQRAAAIVKATTFHDDPDTIAQVSRGLGEALRRITEGAAMIRSKGEAGTGDVSNATTHMRKIRGELRRLTSLPEDELFVAAKELQAPYELVKEVATLGKLPVVLFTAGGIATPADAAMMMQLGAEGVFVGSGIFKSGDPAKRADAIVKATTFHDDPDMLAKVSRGLGEAMVGINVDEIPEPHRLAERGW